MVFPKRMKRGIIYLFALNSTMFMLYQFNFVFYSGTNQSQDESSCDLIELQKQAHQYHYEKHDQKIDTHLHSEERQGDLQGKGQNIGDQLDNDWQNNDNNKELLRMMQRQEDNNNNALQQLQQQQQHQQQQQQQQQQQHQQQQNEEQQQQDLQACPRHYLYHNGKPCRKETLPDFTGIDGPPLYFHPYSAFLDTSSSLPMPTVTTVYLFSRKEEQLRLKCWLLFEGQTEYIQGKNNNFRYLWHGQDRNAFGEAIGTGVFTCEYPKGTPATKLVMSIKLTFRGPGGTVLAITPVEVLAQPPVKKKLAICLGRVYSVPYCDDCTGLNYTYHLPEWMEYQKMMGVDTVFAYNVSMGPDATKIFKHYAEQGFVEVLSHRAVHNETYMPVSLGSIECLVRNKYSYEYIFMTDMDEFLVFDPKWDDFNDMIRDLFAHGDPTKQHKHFAMNQFITGEKEVEEKLKDSKAVPYLKTDRYREFHYDGYRAGKSIVNPRYCQHATAHACVPYNLNEKVDPSLASIHHYKPCSMRQADSKAECYTHLQNMTHSDGAQIFQERLKRNVEQAFHDMQLWGF